MNSEKLVVECSPGGNFTFCIEATSLSNVELFGPFKAFLVASSNGRFLPVVKVSLSDFEKVSSRPVRINVTVEIDESSDLGNFEISELRLIPNDFHSPDADILREKQIQPVVEFDRATSPVIRVLGIVEPWVGGTTTLGNGRFVSLAEADIKGAE